VVLSGCVLGVLNFMEWLLMNSVCFASSIVDSTVSVKYRVKQCVFANSFFNVSIPNGNYSQKNQYQGGF